MAKTSLPRTNAAIALWRGVGILVDADQQIITEEFEGSGHKRGDTDRPLADTASDIRDLRLADLFTEIARTLGLSALNLKETQALVEAYKEFGEDEEYITVLAAHLAEHRKKLTVTQLTKEIKRLFDMDINTAEKLYLYIDNKNREDGAVWEYRRITGLYDRRLSDLELQTVKKWFEDFGFDAPIISRAYDEATKANKFSISYLDGILENWHKAELKTLLEIEAHIAKGRAENQAAPRDKYAKTKKQTPRYGDFDVNDAFAKALQRSYGESDDRKGD